MQVESDSKSQLLRGYKIQIWKKNRVNQVFFILLSNEQQVARFDIGHSVDQPNYATNTHNQKVFLLSKKMKMISFNNIYRTCLCVALINTVNTCQQAKWEFGM